MTFSIVVPNASQSPGLFPAQNNTNYQRLKDIINNDHNFTDSASAGQGIHKQATFINRATPVGLPAGNGILYSQADTTGASQLNWYNGSTNIQLTPGVIQISSSANVTNGAQQVIYADPGFSYQAYVWISSTGVSLFSMGLAVNYNAGSTFVRIISTTTLAPTFSYSGHDLVFTNSLPTGNFSWTLLVTRLV